MGCSGAILVPGHHMGKIINRINYYYCCYYYYYYYITSDRVFPLQKFYFSTEKWCLYVTLERGISPRWFGLPVSPTTSSPSHSGWPREYCELYNYINITNVAADRVTQAGGQRAERPWLKPVKDMNLSQLCCWSCRSSRLWCCAFG